MNENVITYISYRLDWGLADIQILRSVDNFQTDSKWKAKKKLDLTNNKIGFNNV